MGKHLWSTVLFAALLTVSAGVSFDTAEATSLADLIANNGTLIVDTLLFSDFTCSSSAVAFFGDPCSMEVVGNTSGIGLFFTPSIGVDALRPGDTSRVSVQVGYAVDALFRGPSDCPACGTSQVPAISTQQTTIDASSHGDFGDVSAGAGCGISEPLSPRSCLFTLPTPLPHFETGWSADIIARNICDPSPLPTCPPSAG